MSDKSIIVVAYATHRAGMLDEYEAQLASADIPFHLEQASPMPQGANSITMRRRIDYMRAICEKFIDYELIVMTDAWDVLFFGDKQTLVDKIRGRFTVSGERNCYPEGHLSPMFKSRSQWRFVNNGMLTGAPEEILAFLAWADTTPDLHILDQAWFNRRAAEGDAFYLDESTEFFYVVSAWMEDGSLKLKDGRPWNSRYGTYPAWFHFSGKCPDDRFRAMLRGEVESL